MRHRWHRRGRDAGDDLARALQIDGGNLLRAHVGKPQAIMVPAWRLAEHQPGQLGHWRLLGSGTPCGRLSQGMSPPRRTIADTRRPRTPLPGR